MKNLVRKSSRVLSVLFWSELMVRECNLVVLGHAPIMLWAIFFTLPVLLASVLSDPNGTKDSMAEDFLYGLNPAITLLKAIHGIVAQAVKDEPKKE